MRCFVERSLYTWSDRLHAEAQATFALYQSIWLDTSAAVAAPSEFSRALQHRDRSVFVPWQNPMWPRDAAGAQSRPVREAAAITEALSLVLVSEMAQ